MKLYFILYALHMNVWPSTTSVLVNESITLVQKVTHEVEHSVTCVDNLVLYYVMYVIYYLIF